MRMESGLTLVEMMVTIALLAVVMTSVASIFVGLQRAMGETHVRYADLGDARIAINAIQQSLRTAISLNPSESSDSAFITATPDTVEFYANYEVSDGFPKLMKYARSNGEIVETVEDGVLVDSASGDVLEWASVPGSQRQRVLARGVTEAAPLFTFFGSDPSDGALPAGADGALDASERSLVRQVVVDVRVDSDDGYEVGTTQLRNQVVIPNLYYKDEEVSS